MLGRMWSFRHNPAHRIRSSGAYWLLRNGIGDARQPLAKSLDCDVAVVGAGITGALIADSLVGTGARIVMLEAHDVASGSTAATTALLQYEIDTHLVELVERLGERRALSAYRACVASFSRLETRFPELLKLSNYRRRESLYLADDADAVPGLRAELAARRAIGIDCEWLDGDQVLGRFGCRRTGGILSALGAELDPLRFTLALITGVERHGVSLFTRSPVQRILSRDDRMVLVTAQGHEVRAAHVVIAAGYESLDFLPRKVATISNTFALVTEPLAERARVDTMPLIWGSARPYLYLRGTPDGRLMVGGADLPFKNAAARDLVLPRQVRRLARAYQELFGEELPPVAQAWAGSFANTPDGLPYIGAVPGLHPRLQFALCYGGNGITYSAHAADMIRAHVESHPHALDEVFGFEREGADPPGACRSRDAGLPPIDLKSQAGTPTRMEPS
jgi:glycine/D-amino acid oxidase-like deaminating enzyme